MSPRSCSRCQTPVPVGGACPNERFHGPPGGWKRALAATRRRMAQRERESRQAFGVPHRDRRASTERVAELDPLTAWYMERQRTRLKRRRP